METSLAPPVARRRVTLPPFGDLLARQRGHLFTWTPVIFGAGIGWFFTLKIDPNKGIMLSLAICVLGVWVCRILAGSWLVPLAAAVTIGASGFLLVTLRAESVAAPVLEFRYYGPIEGRILKIDKSGSDKPRLTLDQVVLDRMAPDRTPYRVRVSLHGDQPFLTPEPGMTVFMTGHLGPPAGPVEPGGYDFQRKAWFDRLGALGYTRSPALVLEPAVQDTFWLKLTAFRQVLSDVIKSRMSAREGPFAAAILTGDRTEIDPVALEALRASNLAHLLAISGLHMGLLTGVIYTLVRFGLALVPRYAMRWHPKKCAALCALITAFLYLGISGANVATQRAFVMVAVMLIALCLDRRALTLRAVSLAALLVLVIKPESLIGPGFQMSFAATTALVAVFAWLRDVQLMQRFPKWSRPVTSLLLSSAIAGLATAPFGAAHFNQVAHYGLVANLLSVPIMGIVVMPAAVLACVLAVIGLEAVGFWFVELGLRWILWVAETVSGWDGAVSKIVAPDPVVLPVIAFGGLVLCLWQGRWRLSGFAIIAAGFVVWGQAQRPDILVAESGRLIGILTTDGRALNKPKGDGFTAKNWLENDGDPVTQEEAAARGLSEANLVRFSDRDVSVVLDAAKDISPEKMRDYCTDMDVIVVARFEGSASCDIFTEESLRHSGSLAVHIRDTGFRVETTRHRRGVRYWTDQDARARLLSKSE
ncbi:ComEC/Rec2 family competence protein [Litoreibacter roseus]|uniref:Competence protein ComEC n=1 Tax=Litoreibacter roseus TaxID=2601869 RepID=A0A6N6JNE6_9RHOB|nr:ComEC/Rec2 family competence protein [Litoreibacter roseus]GFE66852.1 hypothetical protein KIN_39260 [Litoreibacter roseus]